jgi:hypothetical protein
MNFLAAASQGANGVQVDAQRRHLLVSRLHPAAGRLQPRLATTLAPS